MASRPWHVVYSKEMGKWRVKKENQRKFATKNGYGKKSDAVKSAKRKALSQEVGIVVHRKNNTVHYGFTSERILEMHT